MATTRNGIGKIKDSLKHVTFGKMPTILAGGARRVAGACEMQNSSQDDVFLWAVPAKSSTLRDPFGAVISEIPVMQTIPAGGSISLPLQLKLSRQTPPGEHTITLMLGDEERQMVVHVAENMQLRVEPAMVRLVGAAKAKLSKTLVVTNLGNVSAAIDRLGAVILEEDGGMCRSVQASLRAKGAEGYEPFLDALVAELATTRVDMLRVGVPDDVSEIPPGESRSIALEFHLPGDLTPGRRYFGQLAIGSGVIDVQVTAQTKQTAAQARRSQASE